MVREYVDCVVHNGKIFVADSRKGLSISVFDEGGNLLYEIGHKVDRIKVELMDEGEHGESVSIIFAESENLGSNFELLRQALEARRNSGIAPNMPVLISPTMRCRHKWVVKAFDQCVLARFTEIHFAVPYE